MPELDNPLLRGLLAGVALAAAIGSAVALWALPPMPEDTRTASPQDAAARVRVAQHLATARAFVRMHRYQQAQGLYAEVLLLHDCRNREARQALRAIDPDPPSPVRRKVEASCGPLTS